MTQLLIKRERSAPEAINITTVFLAHISNCLHILTTFKKYLNIAVHIKKQDSITKPMDVYDT